MEIIGPVWSFEAAIDASLKCLADSKSACPMYDNRMRGLGNG
jgi:hypothetical protein